MFMVTIAETVEMTYSCFCIANAIMLHGLVLPPSRVVLLAEMSRYQAHLQAGWQRGRLPPVAPPQHPPPHRAHSTTAARAAPRGTCAAGQMRTRQRPNPAAIPHFI